jgi:hypothetical protein
VMTFKRPVWLTMFGALAMILLGYAGFMGFMPGKAQGDPILCLISFAFMGAGGVGFVASVVWWFVAAFIAHRSSRQGVSKHGTLV